VSSGGVRRVDAEEATTGCGVRRVDAEEATTRDCNYLLIENSCSRRLESSSTLL
jgi:hypothetical protein